MDSTDRERVNEAKEELQKMLEEEDVRDAVLLGKISNTGCSTLKCQKSDTELILFDLYYILVFANKQDLPNPMSSSELADALGLQNQKNRSWYVL